jgi:hypothetical protein
MVNRRPASIFISLFVATAATFLLLWKDARRLHDNHLWVVISFAVLALSGILFQTWRIWKLDQRIRAANGDIELLVSNYKDQVKVQRWIAAVYLATSCVLSLILFR